MLTMALVGMGMAAGGASSPAEADDCGRAFGTLAGIAGSGAPIDEVWASARVALPCARSRVGVFDIGVVVVLEGVLKAAPPRDPHAEVERWLELWSWAQQLSRGSLVHGALSVEFEDRAARAIETRLPSLGSRRASVARRARELLADAPPLDTRGERTHTWWASEAWVPLPVCRMAVDAEMLAIEERLSNPSLDRVASLRALAAEPPTLLERAGAEPCTENAASLAADWAEGRQRLDARVARW